MSDTVKAAESVVAFLNRVADFLESHGRDEGGYSDTTRAEFTADAERLRLLARQRYASRAKPVSESPFRVGERVVVRLPNTSPRFGVVATQARRPDRVNVRLDGRSTAGVCHVSFVERAARPASETPDAPRCTVCGKQATRQDIGGEWWPPCEHAIGLHTLRYGTDSETPAGDER